MGYKFVLIYKIIVKNINEQSRKFIKIGLITDTQEIRLISDKGYDTDINGFDHFTNG